MSTACVAACRGNELVAPSGVLGGARRAFARPVLLPRAGVPPASREKWGPVIVPDCCAKIERSGDAI